MRDFTSIPESISHKQLNSLLGSAPKKPVTGHSRETLFDQKQEAFETLLSNWTKVSKELIFELNNKNDYVIEGRNPQSLMALGALEAHLNIAIQAKQASDSQS